MNLPPSITVCAPRILRVRFGKRDPASVLSYLPPHQWETAPDAAGSDAAAAIESGDLAVRLVPDRKQLVFSDRAGQIRFRIALDGVRLQSRARLRLDMIGEQHFYGLGAGGQQFDRLGAKRQLWADHVLHGFGADTPIPLLLSQAGYGVFFDDAGLGRLDAGDKYGGVTVEYDGDRSSIDLYYIGGGGMRETLDAAAELLGRAPMPPRWALGYMQSSRHFENADELRGLARTIREKRLPCDALIFLSTYGEAKGWNKAVGHLDCEPSLIPEPDKLFGVFAEQHFHVVLHEYPVVHANSPLHAEAREMNYLLDAGYPNLALNPAERPPANYREGQRYLDFSQAEVRTWWWEKHRHLLHPSVGGWWLDGGEGPPADTRLRGGNGIDLHNRFDLLRHEAFAEGEAKDRPDTRVYLLCRSGGAGMQRFGAACWSGDINNTFTTFEAQAAIGLNMGMSGVPYWGTDIGGFWAVTPHTGELFARWFQFGAFCPVFRAHGRVWRQHLPWSYGPEIEAICRRYLELRYRLMPYTYTLAWQAHTRGLPLMRPLVLNYPGDSRVWELGNEYLWGDDLLVAPVTRPGATHWQVYLPKGRWYDFWTHEAHDGPAGITVPAPLDRLPLFVRAGAILPIGPVVQHQNGQAITALTLLVYPEGRSSFTLYEDDGTTNAYRKGGHALTEFECVAEGHTIACRATAPQGDAKLVPAHRSYTFQIYSPEPPRRVVQEGKGNLPRVEDEAVPGWRHDGKHFLFVCVHGQPAMVTMTW